MLWSMTMTLWTPVIFIDSCEHQSSMISIIPRDLMYDQWPWMIFNWSCMISGDCCYEILLIIEDQYWLLYLIMHDKWWSCYDKTAVHVQNSSQRHISKFLLENRQDLTHLKSDNYIAGRQDLNVVVRGEATRGNRQNWSNSQKEAWHRRQSGEKAFWLLPFAIPLGISHSERL